MTPIEDAGFEIRDSLMWLFGSGFPKSLDVSKALDKAAGAEREFGLDDLNPTRRSDGRDKDIENPRLRTNERRNDHPTVKPLDAAYLRREPGRKGRTRRVS